MTDVETIATHISWPPKAAVVIGTYGSPAYIRLQLESRKRYWPNVPALIHDDNSPQRDELIKICKEYGVQYYSPESRLGDTGDASVLVKGIDWAHENGYDLVVKISRRFIIIHEWVSALQTLAFATQYPTYAGRCAEYVYGCRSECFAVHVEAWRGSETMAKLRHFIQMKEMHHPGHTLEEWYNLEANEILKKYASKQVRSMIGAFHIASDAIGCQYWPIMGYSRHLGFPGVIWHNSDYPEDYYYLAKSYGFDDLKIEDFRGVYDKNNGVHIPPPLFFSAGTLDGAAWKKQLDCVSSTGFSEASQRKEYQKIIAQAKRPPNFNSRLLERACTHRIERSQFDMIRWARTITLQPYIISKSFFDKIAVSYIWQKSTIKDAIIEPRVENFARYICEKAGEKTGQILAFGQLPAGFADYVGRVCGRRHRVLGFSDSSLTGAIDQATCDLNRWNNVSIHFPPEGDSQWLNLTRKIDFMKSSLVMLNLAGRSAEILETISSLIERDRPTIVICEPNRPGGPADNFGKIAEYLDRARYCYAVIGMMESCDGVYYPYSPDRRFKKQAILAWPV